MVKKLRKRYIDSMTEGDIARYVEESSLRWTSHILERLFQRNIYMDDVKAVLMNMELWLITVYFPNPAEWTDDFKQRRKL